jgi:predicted RNase H-like nuclease (RuvC/YqgF family)
VQEVKEMAMAVLSQSKAQHANDPPPLIIDDAVQSLERKLNAEVDKCKRMESIVQELRHQIGTMGGKIDDKAMRNSSDVDALMGANKQLTERLEMEKRNFTGLEDEFRAVVKRVHQLEADGTFYSRPRVYSRSQTIGGGNVAQKPKLCSGYGQGRQGNATGKDQVGARV